MGPGVRMRGSGGRVHSPMSEQTQSLGFSQPLESPRIRLAFDVIVDPGHEGFEFEYSESDSFPWAVGRTVVQSAVFTD